jgi:hypothetical protein
VWGQKGRKSQSQQPESCFHLSEESLEGTGSGNIPDNIGGSEVEALVGVLQQLQQFLPAQVFFPYLLCQMTATVQRYRMGLIAPEEVAVHDCSNSLRALA